MHSPNVLPLVTVAMVTYNSEEYIALAIETVLSSSYENFELIISDDNSSDKTWGIIKSYADSRIRAVRNDKNVGEYPNRNQCIDLAKGEYLIFIDGDDMIYPHGLEFMTKMLHGFPECGMALMRWYKNNLFYPVVASPRQFYKGLYFQYGFNDISFSNTFFRVKALRSAGKFPTGIKAGDDYVRMQVGQTDPVLLINDNLTFWRETPGQASSLLLNTLSGQLKHFDLYLGALNGSPLTVEENRDARYNLKIQIARTAVQMIKDMRLTDSWRLLKHYGIGMASIVYYFRKLKFKDPFEPYSPSNLCMEPLSRNPFARLTNNKSQHVTKIKEDN